MNLKLQKSENMTDQPEDGNMLDNLRSRTGGRPPELHSTPRSPVIISNVSNTTSAFDLGNINDILDKVKSLLAADILACDVQVSSTIPKTF